MLRGGFDLAAFAWFLNAFALMFGAYLGGRGLIDPRWAQRLVRLQPDEQGGGFAEFRATYGGLFLALHLIALAFTLIWIVRGELLFGLYRRRQRPRRRRLGWRERRAPHRHVARRRAHQIQQAIHHRRSHHGARHCRALALVELRR